MDMREVFNVDGDQLQFGLGIVVGALVTACVSALLSTRKCHKCITGECCENDAHGDDDAFAD